MSDLITVQGVVLSAMPVGEYDKRIVLLTRERGKISAFAKGARRPNSQFLAAANPFVFGTFALYEGRSSYNLNQVSISHHFVELAGEQPGIYYGYYFLELADYYTRENNDETELLGLLYLSLRALEKENLPNSLVRCIYEIRSLAINGEFPGMPNDRIWNETTAYTIDFIIQIQQEKLYTFCVSKQILEELCDITEIYRRRFIDRPMKSLEMLRVFEAGVEKP